VLVGLAGKLPNLLLLEGYGMSETSSAATFNRPEDGKPGSIGKPMWGVEMRIVDDSGAPVRAGEVGELVIKGHNVMKGYWNDPESTRAALVDGWMHSGDLGYVDDDGFLYVVDRKKDLILRGGYNVYPREVEDVLYGHPSVLEVAVVGIPHDRLGEEVIAFVVPRAEAAADAILEYARERLAAYKYPRRIELVESLPKGASGKVLKTQLRELATPRS
jgi:long-chain acyl-CoA synthetase